MAGHGAFFVNYVITAAFIGTALELIRFSELFMYALKLSLAHSSAEKTAVRKVNICFQIYVQVLTDPSNSHYLQIWTLFVVEYSYMYSKHFKNEIIILIRCSFEILQILKM